MGKEAQSGLISEGAAGGAGDGEAEAGAFAWGAAHSLMLDMAAPKALERGPGRPKGAKNRTSNQLREHLLAHYRDPLDGLGEFVSLPIPEIARVLKCKRLDAAKIWLAALAQYAPYVHQRQPQAVQFDPGGAIPLVVNIGLVQQLGVNPSEFGIDMRVVNAAPQMQQNQGLSAPDPDKSDGDSRTDGVK